MVPTRNRAQRLAGLLHALREQTLPPERFEVIVVDDGSSDGSPDVVEREARSGPLAIRLLRLSGTGPAIARNAGWRRAEADLIAFTDDDCEPCRTWLEKAVRVADRDSGVIVQGPTLPIPRERDLLDGPFARTKLIQEQGPWFQTCNIVYPRSLLEKLGGFDERFPEALGEDTDLGWRALEMGVRAEFAAGAIVYHAVEELGPIGYMRHALRGSDAIYAFRRHPGLRAQTLRFGVFRNPALARLTLALAGVALARRRPEAVLATLPYLRDLIGRSVAHDGWPLLVPYLLAYDLVQVYTSLRGSIRYRTLVI